MVSNYLVLRGINYEGEKAIKVTETIQEAITIVQLGLVHGYADYWLILSLPELVVVRSWVIERIWERGVGGSDITITKEYNAAREIISESKEEVPNGPSANEV